MIRQQQAVEEFKQKSLNGREKVSVVLSLRVGCQSLTVVSAAQQAWESMMAKRFPKGIWDVEDLKKLNAVLERNKMWAVAKEEEVSALGPKL